MQGENMIERLKETIEALTIKRLIINWRKNWCFVLAVCFYLLLVALVSFIIAYNIKVSIESVVEDSSPVNSYSCNESSEIHGGVEYVKYEIHYYEELLDIKITPYPFVEVILMDNTSKFYAIKTVIKQEDLREDKIYSIYIESSSNFASLNYLDENSKSQKRGVLFKIEEQLNNTYNESYYLYLSQEFKKIDSKEAIEILNSASENSIYPFD